MSKITFSKEPAVWIALLGAVAVAVINSGASPELTANAATYSTIVTAVVGVLIRFFVSPSTKTPVAPPAPPAA